MPADKSAVQVDFNTSSNSSAIFGISLKSLTLKKKGDRAGVNVSFAADSFTQQRGKIMSQLGALNVWHANGSFYGVKGEVQPANLRNFNQGRTSRALGGLFTVGPEEEPLHLSGLGTFWVGGVKGHLQGHIDGHPGRGAIAAVIGVDEATGSAEHFAGYFKGNMRILGGIYLDWHSDHSRKIYAGDGVKSIHQHAQEMRDEQQLPGIAALPSNQAGEPTVEVGHFIKGLSEELALAHIYIEMLHERLEKQARDIELSTKSLQELAQKVEELK